MSCLMFNCLQVALLDVALRRNSIVCLGSSSAKQFLAVMLVKKLAYQTMCSSCNGKLKTLVLFKSGNNRWFFIWTTCS